MPLAAVVSIVAAYLVGALSGGLLLGRLLGKGDPRSGGSGNIGATNALRTGGTAFGVATLVFDALKGAVAALAIPALAAPSLTWLPFACAAAAVIGHVYPVYYGFAGGKGAATLIGALLCLVPWAMLPATVVWVATLSLTGYAGLSTILGMTTVLVSILVMVAPAWASPAPAFALAMWLLVLYTHRGNIQRMLAGEENRFERAMILRRR